MLKRIFYTFLIVVSTLSAGAQQDAQFSQYMFNNLYLTPAFAGVDGVTQLTAVHRSQWLGYQSSFNDGGAPTTQMVSFNTPIFKLRSGFGTYIINDRLGALNNQQVQVSYAYHLGIKESKLSFGVQFGAFSQSIDFDKYRAIQKDDPLLGDKVGKTSQIRPDMSVGLFYRDEKYYLGLGVNHIIRSTFDFGVSQRGTLQNQVSLTAGYFYEVNFDLKINPTILVKSDLKQYSFDLGFIATLKDQMWGGLSFRQSEAAIVMLGYSFFKDKSLKFGYALDYIVKDQKAKQPTSHEFMLSYQLPVNPGSGKKVVRTPRYRH